MKSKKIKSQDASRSQITKNRRAKLIQWYEENKRSLPWRESADPYQIWISEVMLQQTTVAAVLPYYEKFLKKFPRLKDLADARLQEVNELWSGLGYYSRAKNMHLAAQKIMDLYQGEFPKSWQELIQLPGFGPYTARAVASLAFKENVGVLDGNVIRVLSRVDGISADWWKPLVRDQLQQLSDALVMDGSAKIINQAMMDLGATICTPQNPLCHFCPWSSLCVAKKNNLVQSLPKKKPRKKMQSWIWRPLVFIRGGKIAMTENKSAPVLKNKLLLPGVFKVSPRPPARFDFKHSITHHNIYIQKQKNVKLGDLAKEKIKWVPLSEIKKHNPSSLIQKTIEL